MVSRLQVLNDIKKAANSLMQYKAQGLDKAYSYSEKAENKKINEANEALIQATIGLSGTKCPNCNGTGRV